MQIGPNPKQYTFIHLGNRFSQIRQNRFVYTMLLFVLELDDLESQMVS